MEPTFIRITPVKIRCVYGPGDNYKPCNRGNPIHLTEPELDIQLSEQIDYEDDDRWKCTQCGNNAVLVE